ncbi:MAG: VOC family protein [Halieaceae bacterium]|jgi:catechol 2,3-dioxygenase-like lactoylglutathione lyase family enzyme|nr:VOC family protein [Halieaceae bacterium]
MEASYFVFGTNDMLLAVAFYDALFDGTGYKKVHAEGRMTLWVNGDNMFALAEPYDGEPATAGNGTMLGLKLDSPEELDRRYRRVLELGAPSEGEPGVRSGRYSAYFRDPDGNKLCLYV